MPSSTMVKVRNVLILYVIFIVFFYFLMMSGFQNFDWFVFTVMSIMILSIATISCAAMGWEFCDAETFKVKGPKMLDPTRVIIVCPHCDHRNTRNYRSFKKMCDNCVRPLSWDKLEENNSCSRCESVLESTIVEEVQGGNIVKCPSCGNYIGKEKGILKEVS